jgi:Tol biopolymer transport system component
MQRHLYRQLRTSVVLVSFALGLRVGSPGYAATTQYCLQYDAHGSTFIANPSSVATDPLPDGQIRHPYPEPRSNNISAPPQVYTEPQEFFEIVPTGSGVVLLLQQDTTGTITQLQRADKIVAAWAPQRDFLAWLWHASDGDHVTIAEHDGTIVRSSIVENIDGWDKDSLAWSADAQYVGILTSHILILSAADLQPAMPGDALTGAWLGWAPVGHRFLLLTDSGYAVYSPDATLLLNFPEGDATTHQNIPVAWSPDGRFLIIPGGAHDTYTLQLYDLTTGAILPKLSGMNANISFGEGVRPIQPWTWSADGRYLIYPAWTPGLSETSSDLLAFDTVTQQIIPLRTRLTWTQYTTLNFLVLGNLAYTATQTRIGVKVGTISVTGENPIYFVNDAPAVDWLSASPDGAYVAFVVNASPLQAAILSLDDLKTMMPPKAQPSDQLIWISVKANRKHEISYPNAHLLTWYGDHLLFMAGTPLKDYQVLSLDPTTGKTTILVPALPYDRYVDTSVWNWGRWTVTPSPDGKTLILQAKVDFAGTVGTLRSGTHTVSLRQSDAFGESVYLATLDGTQSHILSDRGETTSLFRWSPDGTMFAWSDSTTEVSHTSILRADGHVLLQTDDESDALVWIVCPKA